MGGLERPEAGTAEGQPLLCDGSSICQWWPLMLHVVWQASLWAQLACQRGLFTRFTWMAWEANIILGIGHWGAHRRPISPACMLRNIRQVA